VCPGATPANDDHALAGLGRSHRDKAIEPGAIDHVVPGSAPSSADPRNATPPHHGTIYRPPVARFGVDPPPLGGLRPVRRGRRGFAVEPELVQQMIADNSSVSSRSCRRGICDGVRRRSVPGSGRLLPSATEAIGRIAPPLPSPIAVHGRDRLDRKFAGGRFRRQHDGVRPPFIDRGGDIGDFGARRHRRTWIIDCQHLRGDPPPALPARRAIRVICFLQARPPASSGSSTPRSPRATIQAAFGGPRGFSGRGRSIACGFSILPSTAARPAESVALGLVWTSSARAARMTRRIQSTPVPTSAASRSAAVFFGVIAETGRSVSGRLTPLAVRHLAADHQPASTRANRGEVSFAAISRNPCRRRAAAHGLAAAGRQDFPDAEAGRGCCHRAPCRKSRMKLLDRS